MSKKKQQSLNSRQIRHLRGLGHHLSPVAMIGKEGLSESLLSSVKQVLLAHELIKVKMQDSSPLGRKEAGSELAKLTKSILVQVIGKTMLLFRENPDRNDGNKINLP